MEVATLLLFTLYSKVHLIIKFLAKHQLIIFFLPFLVSFSFHPNTNLGEGLGIDGSWYYDMISKDDYMLTDYHLFKSFPAYAIKSILSTLRIEKSLENIIFSFRILNLISILGSVIFIVGFCKTKKLNNMDVILVFFSIFFSFIFLKLPFYNAITPDYFGLFLGFSLFHSIVNNYKIIVIFLLLLAFFTNPIIFLISFMLLIFEEVRMNEHISYSNKNLMPLVLSVGTGSLFATWFVFAIVPMHRAGVRLSAWEIPDELDYSMFPISVIVTSLIISTLTFYIFKSFIPLINLKYLKDINFYWLTLFVFFAFLKSFIIDYNGVPNELDDIGHLLYIFPLYICMKPLCGISEHIQSFGVLIIFTLIYWNKIVTIAKKKLGLGSFFVLLMFILFLIKPETRHTLPFVPVIGYLVLSVIPEIKNDMKFFLTIIILGLILSKFYYPLHLASFESNSFQSFPAQHYLMFFGFSVNYFNYLILLFGSIISFSTLYFVKKN